MTLVNPTIVLASKLTKFLPNSCLPYGKCNFTYLIVSTNPRQYSSIILLSEMNNNGVTLQGIYDNIIRPPNSWLCGHIRYSIFVLSMNEINQTNLT